jgi:hypothetical protein
MAIPIAVTCQLCLQAEDLEAVVAVTLDWAMAGTPQPARLCRRCAFAIVDAIAAIGEAAPLKEITRGFVLGSFKSIGPGEHLRAAGADHVVVEDQPANQPAGDDSVEPGDVAERTGGARTHGRTRRASK